MADRKLSDEWAILQTCSYRLDPEHITPCTCEQKTMIGRVFDTPKEACVSARRFASWDEPFDLIVSSMDHDHASRRHSALGHLAPDELRAELVA